jgi:hypothetical protein
MSKLIKMLLWGAVALAVFNVLAFLGLVLAAIWLESEKFASTAWLWFFVMVVSVIGGVVAALSIYDEVD